MRRRKGLWIALWLPVLLIAAFLVYTAVCYHADETAQTALRSSEKLRVEQTEYGWFFDGPSEDTALVFYPGAKVEETAYAPFLRRLAEEGVDVFLLRVPFRLAFFSTERAADVMARFDYAHWYVGGHSLGGAVAALFAASHGADLDGLILCAAYPTKPLDRGLTMISLCGSEDGVINRQKIEDGRRFAPENSTERVIEGGNHAQFGSYGEQKGDGKASISAEEQWEEAVRIITETVFADERNEEKPAA